METGHPTSDARDDFARQRRRQILARMRDRLAGRTASVSMMLPFDEVVDALGFRGQNPGGQHVISLDSIVGSVSRSAEFDRRFRPTSTQAAARFERINAALRRGEAMPPIEVFRIGDLHFVKDGHHRVAVARAMGWKDINADVTIVATAVGPAAGLGLDDLPLKSHERVFYDRVPLPAQWRSEFDLADGDSYGDLAESIEAWGCRYMLQHRELLDRGEIAVAWYTEEYQPALEVLREADLIGDSSPVEAYMRLSCQRYRLLRTHTWDDDALARLTEGTARR